CHPRISDGQTPQGPWHAQARAGNLHKPGVVIPAPDAPWIECTIVDVSEKGACLDVGSLPVPDLFGLAFTATGEVLRVCSLVWRRGELIGAEFLSASELRAGAASS